MKHHKVNVKLPNGWQKGAPPHIGWWRLETMCDKHGEIHLAWFDGKSFSMFQGSYLEDLEPLHQGCWPIGEIRWNAHWPANARVARINPENGECTGAGPCPYEASGQTWPFKVSTK